MKQKKTKNKIQINKQTKIQEEKRMTVSYILFPTKDVIQLTKKTYC